MSPQGQVELAAISILLFMTWLAVCLRFWVRMQLTKSLGWDDVMIGITLILFVCYCAFILVVIGRGGFDHITVSTSIEGIVTYVLLAEVFYVLTTTTLKISLGLFFLRVLIKKWQRVTFYIILAVSSIYGLFYLFIAIFQCGVPSMMLKNVISGRCLPTSLLLTTGYIYGTLNVIADWTFVIIPIFILRDSPMNRRSKISVGIIMALGALGSICSIIRLVYLKGLVFGKDFFSNAAYVTIWSTLEPGTGIAAASLATLRPLMRTVVHKVRGTIGNHHLNHSTHRRGRSEDNGFDVEAIGDKAHSMRTALVGGQRQTSTAGTDDAPSIPRSASLDSRMKERLNAELPLLPGQIAKVVNVHITSK